MTEEPDEWGEDEDGPWTESDEVWENTAEVKTGG